MMPPPPDNKYIEFCQRGHSEAIAPTQPDAVHNLIGMTALVMWPKLPYFVKLNNKVIFLKRTFDGVF